MTIWKKKPSTYKIQLIYVHLLIWPWPLIFRGLKVFSSEKLFMIKVTGTGDLWIQTRLAPSFVHWADAFRKVERKKKRL